MAFNKTLKEASASLIDRCFRYERSGSGEPKLDDAQLHWIEVWGASYSKNRQ